MARRTAKSATRGGSTKPTGARRTARRVTTVAGVPFPGYARYTRAAGKAGLVSHDVDQYVAAVARATPLEIIEIERAGVPGTLIKDLSKRLAISTSRMF